MMNGFNYAVNLSNEPPSFNYAVNPLNEEKYLEWHDLIDIRVPLFKDPSILLTPRVPTPLHHRNPRSILTQIDEDWWNRTRRKVYESQDLHCACCGVHQKDQVGWVKNQLDAHELYDVNYETGEVKLKAIVPLCKACHNGIHFGRLTAQYESGKIQPKTYYQVISYCNTILSQSNLPSKNWDATVNDNLYDIPWEQWHLTLIIDGKEQKFYSLYKDQADLEAHY